MRKILAALLIAGPALALFSTGAAAQCVPRPGTPGVLDCFSPDGTYEYSTNGPGSFAAPPVYAYAPQPVYAYRPAYYGYREPVRDYDYPRPYRYRVGYPYRSRYYDDGPGCGPYRHWSDAAGRCVYDRYPRYARYDRYDRYRDDRYDRYDRYRYGRYGRYDRYRYDRDDRYGPYRGPLK